MALILLATRTPPPRRGQRVLRRCRDRLDRRQLARRWSVTSKLGSFLDTTADKLLVSGVLIALLGVEPRLAVDRGAHHRPRAGHDGPSRRDRRRRGGDGAVDRGKLKANVQFVAIVLAILRPGEPLAGLYIDEWAMLAAAAITVWSAVDYLVRALPALLAE